MPSLKTKVAGPARTQTKTPAPPTALPPCTSFPIVGIGASAGGLEAFMEMFRVLPANTGMAFVLVQHLSPQHKSMLVGFIQQSTKMEVEEVVEGTRVVPNRIYVIPPNALIEIFHGVLHLRAMPEVHASSMPVNVFFNSLGRDQGHCAVGVILSGTGSDGAHGLRDIKSDGGISLVQEPATAKYDGMPEAAISVASPDYVLSVLGLARELVKIARNPLVATSAAKLEQSLSPENERTLQKIFILVRSATRIDFSAYKYPTILRRIKRRMVLHKLETLKHYLTYLQKTPTEISFLFEDLLINVTDFFRDQEAFAALKTIVFPALVKNRGPSTPFRVWVPGCSTGEEVYSIAISLLEFLSQLGVQVPLQIYGTDICEAAVKIARLGFYPKTAVKNVSDERLANYFVEEANGFRISKHVRDCCIFSIQDVTTHPPINRLDLLSCRNLLIYLGVQVQRKLMETFFFALNPHAFLMLGTSETIGSASGLFSVADKKNKIYLKKSVAGAARVGFHSNSGSRLSAGGAQAALSPSGRMAKVFDPVSEAEKLVLESFAPAWVLANQALDIVQFRGNTGAYVEPPSGQPTWNLIRMLRGGLAAEVRVLMHALGKKNAAVRKAGLRVISEGVTRNLDIEIVPIVGTDGDRFYLVLFLECGRDHSVARVDVAPKTGKHLSRNTKDREIAALRAEVRVSQQALQSNIDDHNVISEQMQTANEEVLSANEELQSTNEELETAKEELQSTNEELTTLNDELSFRNHDLANLTNDLENVLSNINVSIVMVGPDLHIRRFTPTAEQLMALLPADVGRSLADLNLHFRPGILIEKIEEVIKSSSTIEFEVQDRNDAHYSVRIRPYRTVEGKMDGAVVVFIHLDDV